MITAFMVFKKLGYPTDGAPAPWKLYYTTTDRDTTEDEIRASALRYGWKVLKVGIEQSAIEAL